MKRIIKLLLSSILLGITRSFGQSIATAQASTTIIIPISITKTVDMNFGNIVVSPSQPGAVVLDPSGSRNTVGAGGVTLPANSGIVAAASFVVSGQGGYTYAITLPASCTIVDAVSHTMTVNAFTSTPSSTGTLGASGLQTLNVGATLNASAGQATGLYVNLTQVPVTVNYN